MASSIELLALAKLAFYDNRPTATLNQNAAWSTPNSTTPYNTAPFQTSNEDNWGGHSNVTNNTRYTIQVAGTYRVSGALTWTTNGTGIRACDLQKNGTRITGSNTYMQCASANFSTVQVPAMNVVCAVGDYLEIGGFQNSGASLNTVTAGSYLSVEFLHF